MIFSLFSGFQDIFLHSREYIFAVSDLSVGPSVCRAEINAILWYVSPSSHILVLINILKIFGIFKNLFMGLFLMNNICIYESL